MVVNITMHGPGGELDSRVIECEEGDTDAITAATRELLDGAIFDVGDSLTITEVVS